MDPTIQRNTLLTAAGIFILVATILSPKLLSCCTSANGFISITCIIIEGLFAAHSTRKLAFAFLREITNPWYAHMMAPIFLLVALPCTSAIFSRIDNLTLNILNVSGFITREARSFVFMSMELLWILILECPYRNTGYRKEPHWQHLL